MNTESESERSSNQPAGTAFFAWLRGLGIVRSQDRWLTGVAGGLAAKLGIDPLIVRGVFVVLALLGGPGLLLYIVGWLLLPDHTGRIATEDIIRGRASTGTLTWAIVLATLVVVPAVLSFFGAGNWVQSFSVWGWGAWGALGMPAWIPAVIAWIFWIAVICFGAYWLFIVHPGRNRATSTSEDTASEHSASEHPASEHPRPGSDHSAQSFSDRVDGHARRASENAQQWGQRTSDNAAEWGRRVGENATRHTEEWNARYAQQRQARQLGAGQTILTIAIALLAGGLSALWITSAEPALSVEGVVPAALIGAFIAAVVVLALSLIVAGIRGRYTGWIGFLTWCGVVALMITVVLPWGVRFQPFGDIHVDMRDAPGTVVIAGTAHLDLDSLDLGSLDAADSTPHDELDVWLAAGNISIDMPDSSPAVVNVRVLAGNIGEQTPEGTAPRTSGPFLSRTITANIPAGDSPESVATVNVYLLAGNVRVLNDTDSAQTENDPTSREVDQTRRELEQELEQLAWQLEEPGLSNHEEDSLKAQSREIRQELNTLEMETSR